MGSMLDSSEKGLMALVQDYESMGGSVLDIVELAEHHPEQILELAESYGVTQAELRGLVDVTHQVERLERSKRKQARADHFETDQEWVKRTAHEIVAELSEMRRARKEKSAIAKLRAPRGGKKALPERMGDALRAWLKAGQPIKEFFEINADVLGDPRQYELRPFVEGDADWVNRINEN